MTLGRYLYTVLKINYLVLGGASLTTPFYFQYYVEQDLIPESEINHYLTMSNILPGAMSIYMTAYTGLYLHQKKGMFLGMSVLFIPIILISILLFNFISYLPFDISMLMYISLPIMIVACLDYVRNIFSSDLSNIIKYGIFTVGLLLLSLAILGTIRLILVYILIITIFTLKEKYARNSNN